MLFFTCLVRFGFGLGNGTLIDLFLFGSGRMIKHSFGRSLESMQDWIFRLGK